MYIYMYMYVCLSGLWLGGLLHICFLSVRLHVHIHLVIYTCIHVHGRVREWDGERKE